MGSSVRVLVKVRRFARNLKNFPTSSVMCQSLNTSETKFSTRPHHDMTECLKFTNIPANAGSCSVQVHAPRRRTRDTQAEAEAEAKAEPEAEAEVEAEMEVEVQCGPAPV
jgi:hypothetical protein